jgi:hypothetical protein
LELQFCEGCAGRAEIKVTIKAHSDLMLKS